MKVFVARTSTDLDEAFAKFSESTIIGCDTETSGLDPKFGKLFSIQFSDGNFNLLIPISEGVELGPFAELLNDSSKVKIFHNAKFDLDFLSAVGHSALNVFDTMIAEKCLTKGAGQSSSLAETLYRHFGIDLDKSQRSKFNKKWDGVWTEELVNYALSDVLHLPALMKEQEMWLEKLGLMQTYHNQMKKVLSPAKVSK